jgi:hypothetical protein
MIKNKGIGDIIQNIFLYFGDLCVVMKIQMKENCFKLDTVLMHFY